MAPAVTILNGDGSELLPTLVHSSPPEERLAVIFDGEKRKAAYTTYKKIQRRVHLAVFDDTDHQRFANLIAR